MSLSFGRSVGLFGRSVGDSVYLTHTAARSLQFHLPKELDILLHHRNEESRYMELYWREFNRRLFAEPGMVFYISFNLRLGKGGLWEGGKSVF